MYTGLNLEIGRTVAGVECFRVRVRVRVRVGHHIDGVDDLYFILGSLLES